MLIGRGGDVFARPCVQEILKIDAIWTSVKEQAHAQVVHFIWHHAWRKNSPDVTRCHYFFLRTSEDTCTVTVLVIYIPLHLSRSHVHPGDAGVCTDGVHVGHLPYTFQKKRFTCRAGDQYHK